MYPVCPITTTINLNLMNFSHRDTLWKVFSDYADDYEYTSDGNVIGSINNDLLRNDDPKAYLLTKSPRNTAARSYVFADPKLTPYAGLILTPYVS